MVLVVVVVAAADVLLLLFWFLCWLNERRVSCRQDKNMFYVEIISCLYIFSVCSVSYSQILFHKMMKLNVQIDIAKNCFTLFFFFFFWLWDIKDMFFKVV